MRKESYILQQWHSNLGVTPNNEESQSQSLGLLCGFYFFPKDSNNEKSGFWSAFGFYSKTLVLGPISGNPHKYRL